MLTITVKSFEKNAARQLMPSCLLLSVLQTSAANAANVKFYVIYLGKVARAPVPVIIFKNNCCV
jgi:hypothetical protein